MVNSFLSFTVTKEFRISYLGIGPTEIRLVFILVNTALIVFGKTHLGPALPWALVGSAFGLMVTVARTQRRIWRLDMANKEPKDGPEPKNGPGPFSAVLNGDGNARPETRGSSGTGTGSARPFVADRTRLCALKSRE